MRVLIIHSRYWSGAAFGENRVVDDEARLLASAGHDVHLWDPRWRQPTRSASPGRCQNHLVAPSRGKGRQTHSRHQPEVVHCHNMFPALSPSVLRTAVAEGAAVVATLHNHRMLCLPSTLLKDGRLCEDCLGKTWRGVLHHCYQQSLPASGALAVSLTLHHALGTFTNKILYLAVSDSRCGPSTSKRGGTERAIRVKPNFAWPVRRREGAGEYFLYVGRLSPEKGVASLLTAWRALNEPLLVVGDGPEAARLRAMAPPGVDFLGQVEPSEVPALLARARGLLMPSICYEGEPRATWKLTPRGCRWWRAGSAAFPTS